jgi:signal transduction histidine kinase
MAKNSLQKSTKRFISHEVSSQRQYIWSYIWAFLIGVATYLIEHNRMTHLNDRNYWLQYIEPIFNVNFSDRGMNVAVLATGYTLALFVFTTTALIKRSRLEKYELQRQIGIQQARDDLLALASHQLRTPATSVKQYLGILLDDMAGTTDDINKKIIQKAYDNNEKQLRIINDFLYMAKLDSGRIVIHPVSFMVKDAVKNIISEYAHRIEENNITCSVTIRRNVTIKSDKQCFRMAFENILSNAVKYTPQGGTVEIDVYTRRKTLYIRVSDTGIGVPKQHQKQLFRKYIRFDNAQIATQDGTGIGLYIAKNLMELNGGTISYMPNGRGSSFTIQLPIKL